MDQILIAVLAVAGFVLAVDLLTTHLRKRARSLSVTPELTLTGEDSGDEPTEEFAIE